VSEGTDDEQAQPDEARLQLGAAVRTFVTWTLPLPLAWALVSLVLRPEAAARVLFLASSFSAIGVAALRLSHTRWVHAACVTMVAGFSLLVFYAAWSGGGVQSPAFTAFTAVIVIASALLGQRAASVAAVFAVAAGGYLVWLEQHSLLPVPGARTTVAYYISCCLIFGTVTTVQLVFARVAREGLRRVRREAESRQKAERASDLARQQSDQTEQRYRQIFQSAAVALFEIDLAEALSWQTDRGDDASPLALDDPAVIDELLERVKITDVNDAAVQCMDASDKRALIAGAVNAARPRTRAAIVELIAAVRPPPSRLQREVEVETLQGRSKRLLVDLFLPERRESWSRIVASVVDVTELRRLEERTRAAERLESIGRLAGGVAHDFNNALAVIMSWASMLQKPGRSEEQRAQGLDAITQSAARAAELTRQLLSLGRRDVRAPRPTDVQALIDETVHALARLLPADITVRVQHGCSELALVDAGQLQQVLLNLALNARDAMPDGGLLELRTRLCAAHEISDLPPQPHIEICVRDTGIGMDAATRARLFEPFFTTKSDGGTGLGLATAHAVVTQSGGKITVETSPGRGSAFFVYLPQAQETIAGSSPRLPAVHPQRGQSVLLVEDEALVREVMVQTLRDAGYRVLEASHGDEAVRVADAQPSLDLLCADGILPGIPTRELIQRIAQRFPGIPVLVCSGHLQEELVRRQIADGRFAFLAKPFRPEELVARVAALLASTAQPRATAPGGPVGATRDIERS
jgi:signal transduction histidine kinase/ActR/RegA family two-component response regulator